MELPSAKIIHLLINLVKNAVESLALIRSRERVLSVGLGETQQGVFIRVADNGVGIAPDHLPQLCTHGFTTKEQGHGFGLRYCAKTARELGGDLTVESEGVDRGAVFTIALPFPSRTGESQARPEQEVAVPTLREYDDRQPRLGEEPPPLSSDPS